MCQRCRRPVRHCLCALIPCLPSRTRVIFLQHPREARVAIGTARMAQLALPNSELREGIAFAGLDELAADPTAAVLFPDPHAAPVDRAAPPRTLVVVDGTWPQARQIIRKNPLLARMRRIGLTPARPGAYRIRREPAPECLATVEAVAEVLGVLEDDPGRFAGLLAAFTFMVERQLECARGLAVPRRRARRAAPPPLGPEVAALARAADEIVLVHGEANSHGAAERSPGPPELLHLVASARGRRFEAMLAPRRPLGARTALHLDVGADRLRAGETVAAALARFAELLGPRRAVLCGWGPFAVDLLEREGLAPRPRIDLRAIVARRLPGHPRGLDRVAAALAVPAQAPWASGRAGRAIVALEGILAALLARAARST
jgi:tRNA-uridine aminocarboxypropyltransferase